MLLTKVDRERMKFIRYIGVSGKVVHKKPVMALSALRQDVFRVRMAPTITSRGESPGHQ
jgi:hypothetical protein